MELLPNKNKINGTIVKKYNLCDLIVFAEVRKDLNSLKLEKLLEYFTQKCHRTFCLNNNYSIQQIDELIKINLIKDCVLIVQDSCWEQIIVYLKDKYNFKVIYNYKYDIKEFDCIETEIKRIHELVSIIIITFNNLNFTKECIKSILSKTAYPNYEILIVDNNSSDGTKDYLAYLKDNYNNITVVLNPDNYGFAKANNIGLIRAKGEYIILLNNDTIVTKGWITGIVKHLSKNKNIGQLGVVTNKIGTAAEIPVTYTELKDMDCFAEKYTTDNFNKLYTDIDLIAMFCMAMRKEVINQIGYLDESFGLGLLEDDDYTNRVLLKGYTIACAEDVFIHHYQSASFSKIPLEQRIELSNRNIQLYEKKWNKKWVPHKLRNK